MKLRHRIAFRLFLIVAASIGALVGLEVVESKKAEQLFLRSIEQQLTGQVQTALGYLHYYDQAVQAGQLTLEEAKARATDVMTRLRVGSDGYFFAFDSNLVVVAHGADRTLIGQNQNDLSNRNQQQVFVGLQDAARQPGGGTYRYDYPKPGQADLVPKLAYVERFAAWDWTIGTGAYLDELYADVTASQRMAMYRLAGVAAVLTLLCAFLGRSITRPMAAVTARMEAMTAGDAEAPVPAVDRRDEVGKMAKSVDVFREKLLENRRLESEAKAAQTAAEEAQARAADAKLQAEREEVARAEAAAEAERTRQEAEVARERERQMAETTRMQQDQAAQAFVVGEIGRGLTSLAAGDLTIRLTDPFDDRYDRLRVDFNSAIGALSGIMGNLAAEAASLNKASDTAAKAAGEANGTSQKNVASLEESSSAINEISASVSSAARSAKEVSERVKAAEETARTSRDVVEEAVAAMHEIAGSSQQVESIISVIETIAFQTNLLALNAGVEAARAGEQGRGFAVVASEVRALAQRSSDAATDIRNLIEQSTQQVEAGVGLVDSTGANLQEIADAVLHISSEVQAITSSTEEQGRSLASASAALTAISEASQAASASLALVDSSCDTMASSCAHLLDHVGHFKTEPVAPKDRLGLRAAG